MITTQHALQAVQSLLHRPDHADATTLAVPAMLDGSSQTALVPDTAEATTLAVPAMLDGSTQTALTPDHAQATILAVPAMHDGSTQTAPVPDTAQQITHAVVYVTQHAAAVTSIRASLAMGRDATAATRQLTEELRLQSEAASAQPQTNRMSAGEDPELTVSDAVEQHAFAAPATGATVFADQYSTSQAIISGGFIASAADTILAKVSNSDSPDEDYYSPSQAAPNGSNTPPAEPASTSQATIYDTGIASSLHSKLDLAGISNSFGEERYMPSQAAPSGRSIATVEPASTSQATTDGTGIAFSMHSKIDQAGISNSNSSDEDRYILSQAGPCGSSIATADTAAGNTELAEHRDYDASSSQHTSTDQAHSATCSASPGDHSMAADEQVVDNCKESEAVSTLFKTNEKPKGRFARFRGCFKPIKGNRFL